MIEYGMSAIGQQDIISRVTPYLQEASQHTSLTALLAVWTHTGPVIASIWSSTAGLNIGGQIGSHLPILSSVGKISSAFHIPSIIEEWKKNELNDLPKEKREAFQTEEETIRKTGIAFATEPLVPFVSSASAPLYNYNNQLIGVFALVGFSQIVPQKIEDDYAQYLLKVTQEISESFGASVINS